MFNHAFTLLMNAEPTNYTSWPGEELVDQDFMPLTLPTYLSALRATLFGTNPDRAMLSYRTKQCIRLIDATPLGDYLQALDSRVSYQNGDPAAAWFAPVVKQISGELAELTVEGQPEPPDTTGCMHQAFKVVIADNVATVERQTPPILFLEINLEYASGRSSPITLPGAGYAVRTNDAVAAQTWLVDILNAPQNSLGAVADAMSKLGAPLFLSLFGAQPVEPYATFANLWHARHDLPMKFAGLLCAMIYRTEEARQA